MLRRVTLFLLFSYSLHAELTNKIDSCWDGTTTDNKAASISIDGNNVEIGLTASFNLFPDMKIPVLDSSGIAIINYGQQTLFLAFDASECSQNQDRKIRCEANTSEYRTTLTNTLFIRRFVDDLGEPIFATTSVPINRAVVDFDSNHVTGRIFNLNVRNSLEEVIHVEFNFQTCNEEGHIGNGYYFPTAYFSERLRAFVQNNEDYLGTN